MRLLQFWQDNVRSFCPAKLKAEGKMKSMFQSLSLVPMEQQYLKLQAQASLSVMLLIYLLLLLNRNMGSPSRAVFPLLVSLQPPLLQSRWAQSQAAHCFQAHSLLRRSNLAFHLSIFWTQQLKCGSGLSWITRRIKRSLKRGFVTSTRSVSLSFLFLMKLASPFNFVSFLFCFLSWPLFLPFVGHQLFLSPVRTPSISHW